MYKREFDALLQKRLPKAVLLYGENDYFIDRHIDLYKTKLDASQEALTLYFDEWDFDRAKSYLSQSSLFGGTNLLIVKHDKKLPKKELDALVALANAQETNYFLYAFRGADGDARTLQSAFSDKKGGVWVRFFEASAKEAVALLQQKAQQLGLQIDHYALQHLINLLHNNLSLCMIELEKLSVLNRPVTSKEIDRLVYSTAPLAVEQLLTEIFEKAPIIATIARLLELGYDEFSILRATQYFLNDIFLLNAYIKLHGAPDFNAIFGFTPPPHIRERKQRLALRIKSSSLLKIYEHLIRSDLRIKQAPATQREALLYAVLIQIQRFL